jgi:hypothetical protein
MSFDDISPVERDMLKRALKLSCTTFAQEYQKRKYGSVTVESFPSSNIEVTNHINSSSSSSSSSASSPPVKEREYVSNVEESMILRASRNSKESCKDDSNKRSGMQLHHEQEMAVAIAASKGKKQFYRGKLYYIVCKLNMSLILFINVIAHIMF